MPIDTAAKRVSALVDFQGILFPPDGAIGAPDRLALLGQYSGIAAGDGIPIIIPTGFAQTRSPKRYTRTNRLGVDRTV